jgi:two-component system, NtrC family, response regulator AtoC
MTREARKSGSAGNEPSQHILVVDDEREHRDVLRGFLEDIGYSVTEADSGTSALDLLSQTDTQLPDLVLLDQRMHDLEGTEVLDRMLQQGIDVPVIVATGYSSANLTIKATQQGAADYVTKPFDFPVLQETIERVLRHERSKRETEFLKFPPKTDPAERIVGTDPRMIDIFKRIGQVARTPTTVLVTGETGTGKELMAEAIHNSSKRKGALIKVNCAALPETLLESELFGHEKGSFTGALALHKGRFEAANTGTIFLDEVGEMSPSTQKKLLRVLQEHEFERVGGTAPIKVDVRVVAATNKNLRDEVLAGRFREDLFFRLNVVPIHMPPLRERKGDIPALVAHFLDKHRYGNQPPARISEAAVERLVTYDWPGNVRELENVIQRAVVLSRGGPITADQIIFQSELNRYVLDVEQKVHSGTALEEMLRDIRREAIFAALRMHDHDPKKAAEQIKISLEILRQECSELGIEDQITTASWAGSGSYLNGRSRSV